jgi:phage gpG-like protein
MTVQKVGQWAEARAAVTAMGRRMEMAQDRATKQEAQLFRAMIVRAFNSRGATNGKTWAPNAPATKAAKGSSKPLIDSGQLRNSVAVVETGDQIFVGVPSKARRKDGGPLVDIAAVHEYGKIIVQKRGGSVVVIKIPERSFIRSTAAFHFKDGDVKKRYLARVATLMGPGWSSQASASAKAMAMAGKAAAKGGK